MGVEVEVVTSAAAFRPAPPRGHITLFPQLKAINRVLAAAGAPTYGGPSGGEHLCLRIGSYSTLSALMRHAAELAIGPRPAGRTHWDYLVQGYAEVYPPGTAPPFQHLALHSDCDGFFVPVDFPQVLDGGPDLAGRFLGSAMRLRAECEELADLHGFPLLPNPVPEELPGWPSHEDVWNRMYHIGSTAFAWYEANDGWGMMTCAKLHYAACYAIRTNGLMLYS